MPALVVATYRDDQLDRHHPLHTLVGDLATHRVHAWLFRSNPLGMFADWNPRVSCARSTESY